MHELTCLFVAGKRRDSSIGGTRRRQGWCLRCLASWKYVNAPGLARTSVLRSEKTWFEGCYRRPFGQFASASTNVTVLAVLHMQYLASPQVCDCNHCIVG
jgi:hypothetical protein